MRATVISASGVILKTLIDSLGRAGTQEVSVIANAIGDSYLFEPAPDFVVGVLSPLAMDPQQGLTNLDVMLRIGRSAERNIPTLLIVPPPLSMLSPVAGVAVAHCPTDNEAALALHVSTIVAIATNRREITREQAPRSSDKSDLYEMIAYLDTGPKLSPAEFENIVGSILANGVGSQGIVSQVRNNDDVGVDMVVSPADAPDNIVLIQAKYWHHMDPQRIARSESELQNYVTSRHANIGLLIFYDQEGQEFSARSSPRTPLVVSASLRRLARQLVDQNLLQILTKATAETAGGVSS
jgi:Restriction endonuclease